MHLMTPLLPALLAGIAYVVTPGPGFVAMVSGASVRPLAAGARFAGGLLAGSAAWLAVTLGTFAGAGSLPGAALELLGIACALYLAYLGGRLILVSAQGRAAPALTRPLREGLVLSVTNPKAFPVLTAVFGGFVLADGGPRTPGQAAVIFLAGLAGFAVGYALMLGLSRAPAIRAFYRAHLRLASAVFGAVFWLFALETLLGAPLGPRG